MTTIIIDGDFISRTEEERRLKLWAGEPDGRFTETRRMLLYNENPPAAADPEQDIKGDRI